MKKIFLFICFLFCNLIQSQPLGVLGASVGRTYFEGRQIYFKEIHAQVYSAVSEYSKNTVEVKNGIYTSFDIPINSFVFFIKDNNVMQLKLIFNKYDPLPPLFLKMHFIKGTFIIDMNECVKENGHVIKNFPCDCISYSKEENEEN
ncbi:hypothetical protein B4N84_21750 [Flavobacterium sp. IR1]|nr:hypothetical protein B4N84_21750 [Flavobacterium sp. IR1]